MRKRQDLKVSIDHIAASECKICGASFQKAVQLGGHLSKAHPGTSDIYTKKKLIREALRQDREYRAKAKKWLRDAFGAIDLKTKRDRITKVKKILENGGQPMVVDYQLVKVGIKSSTK